MTTTVLHPQATAYLHRLRQAARRLPREARDDLIDDITGHLQEAIAVDASDAEVLSTLDRLGSPEEIVAAQLGDPAGLVVGARGTREWAAIVLLLVGGFVVGVGWLIGLVALWSSRAWSTRDKVIGTLIIPGGLAAVALVALLTASKTRCVSGAGMATRCTGGPSGAHQVLSIVLLAIAVIAPIATSIHLARAARRPA